jgi:hypothetical protein
MMSKDGDKRQADALRKFGIEPPPSPNACNRLLTFIIRGNGTIADMEGRIAVVKQCQAAFVGKQVHDTLGHKEGTVLYLTAKSRRDVLESHASKELGEGEYAIHPLKAFVDYGDHKKYVSMGRIVVIKQPNESP